MGYSTTIYAVDLDALRSTVGSKDARLMEKFRKAAEAEAAESEREGQGPRVKVTRDSQIILNGSPLSWEEYAREMRRPRWKGTSIRLYIEGSRRTGRFKDTADFWEAQNKLLAGTGFVGTEICNSDEDLEGEDDDEEEISEAQAAVDLIAGDITHPDAGYQYGYALELLCETLGTHLATIEGSGGMLAALELDTPLSKERSPMKLPEIDDFPGIGYLTAEEVEREVKRLGEMDLSFPGHELLEEDRKTFLQCLKKAAKKQVGVVAFYY